MSDAAKIHIAERPPVYCSSCHQQKPDERHVDFGAYYDGPVMQLAGGGQDAVAIDDLVICETCMKAAANAIGYVNAPALQTEINRVKRIQERLSQRNAALAASLRKVLDANATLVQQRQSSLDEVRDAAAAARRAQRNLDANAADHETPAPADDLATV